jgi:hypothetical protein
MLVGDESRLLTEVQQDDADDQANEAAPKAQNRV